MLISLIFTEISEDMAKDAGTAGKARKARKREKIIINYNYYRY